MRSAKSFRTLLGSALACASFAFGQEQPLPIKTSATETVTAAKPKMSLEEIENFLRTAKVVERKTVNIGVTGTTRARLAAGDFVHDAHIQTIDVRKNEYETPRGKEMNFRDDWRYNVAAYRLSRMLGLDMVPPSVERKDPTAGTGAFTWWVDDVLMDEVTRHKKKMEAPNPDEWNRQMYIVRVFDQLIYNTDRNLQNLVIDKDWRLWMIDHTRALRMQKALPTPKNLVQCDRKLLQSLKSLEREDLRKNLMPYLNKMEIDGLLARRDVIVKFFEAECAKKGEGAVLYDLSRR